MLISKACFEDDDIGEKHTISRPKNARYGSLRIEMDSAPRGRELRSLWLKCSSRLLELKIVSFG